MRLLLWAVLVLLPFLRAARAEPDDAPTVTCPAGTFTGKQVRLKGFAVNQFLGIRYAKPPIRFAKPLPAPNAGSTTATSFGPMCPQISSSGIREFQKEDCLFLNVYAPANLSSTSAPIAVMTFVHGGSYITGAGSQYDGSVLAGYGYVILVTINYRLGLLGHFSTGDDAARGNYALWDQQLAFEWVHDNIRSFGGDIDKVTIFGESAGSKYVAFHGVSSGETQGLYHRIISESGTIFSPWSFSYLPRERQLKPTMEATNCTGTSEQIVACLRAAPLTELVSLSGLGWAPVKDGEFLTATPIEMKARVPNPVPYLYNFSNYDYLLGFNSQEGLLMASVMRHAADQLNETIDTGLSMDALNSSLYKLITNYYTLDQTELLSTLLTYAYNKTYKFTSLKQRLIQLVKIVGDARYVGPTIDFARMHTNLNGPGRTYLYEFDHKRYAEKSLYIRDEGPSWLRVGADHTDELPFVFGAAYAGFPFESQYSPEEVALSVAMMEYWTSFAKTGKPTTAQSPSTFVAGQEYGSMDEEYILTIHTNSSRIDQHPRPHVDYLWSDIVPAFIQHDIERCRKEVDDGLFCDLSLTKCSEGSTTKLPEQPSECSTPDQILDDNLVGSSLGSAEG